MGRTKKVTEEKKKFEYKYPEYITKQLVPFIKDHIDDIEAVFKDYEDNGSITKKQWETIYEYVSELCKFAEPDDSFINPLKIERLADVKYHKEHSAYYNGTIGKRADIILKRINMIKKSDEPAINDYQTLAYHLFFFIEFPEKI